MIWCFDGAACWLVVVAVAFFFIIVESEITSDLLVRARVGCECRLEFFFSVERRRVCSSTIIQNIIIIIVIIYYISKLRVKSKLKWI
jgi:hypothetical protein